MLLEPTFFRQKFPNKKLPFEYALYIGVIPCQNKEKKGLLNSKKKTIFKKWILKNNVYYLIWYDWTFPDSLSFITFWFDLIFSF